METLTVGRGDDKRQVPVAEVSDRDLQWYATSCRNAKLKSIAQAEIARRGGSGGSPAPAPQRQAIQRAETSSLGKAIHNPAAVTKHLQELSESYHVVSPATRVDALPEGCGIAVSYVYVDPNPDMYNGPKEVYDVGGRLGLSGDTLKRIAAAAGVDWDPRQCGRLDDGSDPHYVHYRAVGRVRSFDGSLRTLTGEVEIDAREGSPQIDEIREKAKARAEKKKQPNDGGESQIRELRKFILRHAESKAKNRAIADMGVKRSYAPAELQKPFAVARLMWTGQTSDPELRREFARMHAQSMIQGTSALYGAPPPPALSPPSIGHTPPPPGDIGFDGYSHDYDAEGESKSEPRNEAPQQQQDDNIDRGDDPDQY